MGAYFRALRDLHGWSMDAFVPIVEKEVGHSTAKSTFSRFETGETWPASDVFMGLIVILGADFTRDVLSLRDEKATIDDAKRAADKRFSELALDMDHLVRVARTKPAEQFEAIMQQVRNGIEGPSFLATLKAILGARQHRRKSAD